MRGREPTARDWAMAPTLSIAYAALVALAATLLLPAWWPVWACLVVGGLAALVRWHARYYVYQCRACGRVFGLSGPRDFLGPNGLGLREGRLVGWKLLRCPACRRWGQVRVLRLAAAA